MLSLLNACAYYIELVLQRITSTVATIAEIGCYYLTGSRFIAECLITGAKHLWDILTECYQISCNFYTVLKFTLKDSIDYFYNGTMVRWHGDSLWLAEKVMGLLQKLTNLFVGLGQYILWILLLLPGVIIDYTIRLLNVLGNYIFFGGINLLHDSFRFCIGLVTLLLVYMFRRYVMLFAVCQLKRLHDAFTNACTVFLEWVDQQLICLLQLFDFRNIIAPLNDMICVVCMDRGRNVVVLPCRHLCICRECSQQLHRLASSDRCPVCRHKIESLLHVFS